MATVRPGQGFVPGGSLDALRLYLLKRSTGIDTAKPGVETVATTDAGAVTVATFGWTWAGSHREAPAPDGFVVWEEWTTSAAPSTPLLRSHYAPITARGHQTVVLPGFCVRVAVQTFRVQHERIEFGELVQSDEWVLDRTGDDLIESGAYTLLAGRPGDGNATLLSTDATGSLTGSGAAGNLALNARSSANIGADARFISGEATLDVVDGAGGLLVVDASSRTINAASREVSWALIRALLGNWTLEDSTNAVELSMVRDQRRLTFKDDTSNLTLSLNLLKAEQTVREVTGTTGTNNNVTTRLIYDRVDYNGVATGDMTVTRHCAVESSPQGDNVTVAERIGMLLEPISGSPVVLESFKGLWIKASQGAAEGWSLCSQDTALELSHVGDVSIGEDSTGDGSVPAKLYVEATDEAKPIVEIVAKAGQSGDLLRAQGTQALFRVKADGTMVASGVFTSTPALEAVIDENIIGASAAEYASVASAPAVQSSAVISERVGFRVDDISGIGSQQNFVALKVADQTASGTKKSLLVTDTAMVLDHAGPAAFGGAVSVPDDAYNATSWNGSLQVPTKNAIRDKIESLAFASTAQGALADSAWQPGDTLTTTADAYNASTWNGSLEVPTKDAIRDKIESLSSGGLAWTEVTGTSQAAAVNSGYIANNAARVTVTLPATAAVGSIVRLAGKGAGKWRLQANTGQTISLPWVNTTTGGYLDANERYASVEVLCVTADTTWVLLSSAGNFVAA